MDKALPKMTLKVAFVKGVEAILPVGTTFILENFALSLEETPITSGSLTEGPLLPLVLPKPADRGIAEIFSGMGGWGMATEAFGAQALVSLEKDHATAKCHAQNAMIPTLETDEAIALGLAGELPVRFILVGDVFDSRCWAVMSWKRIAYYFASPPCQSWSGAGWQQGLESVNGQAMEVCVERTTLLQARSLTMENVPSIQTHPDLQHVKKLIQQCNYVIGHEGIDEIYPVLPIKRKRWLLTILPKGKTIDLATIEYAKQAKFPSCLPVFGARNSLALARAFNDHVLPWEQEALKPSADAMELAKDRSLLPKHMMNGPAISSQDDVLKRRTIGQWEPVPSLMSCYGGQHELPRDLLKHHGLHSWFLKDGDHIRYLSPFEGAFALGFSSKLILPADFRSAHRLIGNAISFAHSTLQVWRTHLLLGQDSPFRTDVLCIADLVELIFDRTGRFGDNVVVRDGNFAHLAFPGAAERKRSQTDDEDSPEDSQAKRARSEDISPTVPFEVVGMDPCEVDLAMPYLKPKDLQRVSVAARLYTQPLDQGAFEEGSQELLPVEHLNSWEQGRLVQVANMVPCQLLHEQKIWTEFVWLPKDTNIGFAIQQALPHALECHFQIIQHDIAEVGFHDRVNPEQPCTIFLDTVKIDRLVSPAFTQDSLLVSVDVCWKFSDLIAYVASQCGVLPSKVVILDDHAPMPESAFVLQQLSTSFKAALVTNPLDTRQLMPKKFCDFANTKEVTVAGVKVTNPMHSDNAVPADSAAVRFAARNPNWGSIRSVAVNKQEPVGKLVQTLFPDFRDPVPNVTAESAIIDPTDTVETLIAKTKLEVHFEGFKPWPVTDLEFLLPFGPPSTNDPACLMQLWVQGPFDYRAKRVQVDKEWTLTKLAASYQVLHRSNLTMIVLQHGKPLDPRQQIQHVCSKHEIQIRVCALPGGAKSEDLVKFLEPLLTKRGVPADAVKARVQAVLAKLDHATIRAHMHDDAQTFWGYLKQWANDAKLRLITPDELKAQKKAGRAEARAQAASSSATPSVQKFQEASTQQVVIDTTHFLANGSPVPKIDINAFAPDSTGIAVVSPAEALKCMPVYKTSILVFKDRARYVEGEFRFRQGYCKGNPRKMVAQWAEKEMRNLRRLGAAGIPCPEVIDVRQNVLVMDFLGQDSHAAPRLKDTELADPAAWESLYIDCAVLMRKMMQQCKLVHGDLSEYNMLHHEGRLYIIDVSQSVESEHPQALDFLKRDCVNVNNFFGKRMVNRPVPVKRLFDYVVTREDRVERSDANTMAESKLFKDLLNAAANGTFDEEDAEDEVFIQTWIPSNLNQVSDQKYLDRELEKRQNGEEVLYERLLAGENLPEDPAAASVESEVDNDATEEEQEEESHSDSDEKRNGHKPEGMDKAEWKKKVKEDRREKRKEKVPKALKKRYRKQAAQGR
ncbi:unnamed protein product [Durusdinium trenchii]|uniref:non-specific serine/threonine protein kinase n=1 Tax=Durusdinium trenchii TaxID=1381693 RepID=A0ABP0RS70_9DINO